MASPHWERFAPWLRGALTTLALVAVALALRDALADADGVPWPSRPRLVAAGGLMAGCIIAAAAAWTRLLQGPAFRALLPGFATAQLAKYIPGSIWQGVSQVLAVEVQGVGRGRASLAFALQLWTQLSAAFVVAAPSLMALHPLGSVLALLLLAMAIAAVLRPVLVRVPRLLPRSLVDRIRLHRPVEEVLPLQGVLIGATVLGAASIALAGGGYSVLLTGSLWSPAALVVVSAFAAAWVAGFVLVPLPAGLGVREFVLVLLLGDAFGTATVLTAAVVYRAVTLVSEVALAAVAPLGCPR